MISWLSRRAGKGFVEGVIDAAREWINKVLKVRPRQVNDPTPPVFTFHASKDFTENGLAMVMALKRKRLEAQSRKVKEQAHDVLKGMR